MQRSWYITCRTMLLFRRGDGSLTNMPDNVAVFWGGWKFDDEQSHHLGMSEHARRESDGQGGGTGTSGRRGGSFPAMAVARALPRSAFVQRARRAADTGGGGRGGALGGSVEPREPPPRVVAAGTPGEMVQHTTQEGVVEARVEGGGVQSQVEALSSPIVGQHVGFGACFEEGRAGEEAGPSWQGAKALLMSPTATRTTFEVAALTPERSRHVHWRRAVDAGAGWYCSNCMHLAQASRCEACGASHDSLTPYATASEVLGVTTDALSCRYGRNLRFTQCREQAVAEGVGLLPGQAGYAEAVFSLTERMVHGSDARGRAEEVPHSAVCCFDAWLLLHTGDSMHPVRCWTRDHVRSFLMRDDVEALVTEFVQDHARQVHVPGSVKPVQVLPKGGWWRCVCAHATELDFHVVRAIFGMEGRSPGTPHEVVASVLDGSMATGLYARLAAVAASLFARMAVFERGAGGRARRAGVSAPTVAAFASNSLRVPRSVVAQLVQRAVGARLSRQLGEMERGRVVMSSLLCHALLKGVLPDGTSVVLVRLDLAGSMRWVEECTLRSTDVGGAALHAWEALELPAFGLSPIALDAAMQLPVLIGSGRQCTSCRSWRSEVGAFLGKVEVCVFCMDADSSYQMKTGRRLTRMCAQCGLVRRRADFSDAQWQTFTAASFESRCSVCVQALQPLRGYRLPRCSTTECRCGMSPCLLVRAAAFAADPSLPEASAEVRGAVDRAYAAVRALQKSAGPLSKETLRTMIDGARRGALPCAAAVTDGAGSSTSAGTSGQTHTTGSSDATQQTGSCVTSVEAAARWLGSCLADQTTSPLSMASQPCSDGAQSGDVTEAEGTVADAGAEAEVWPHMLELHCLSVHIPYPQCQKCELRCVTLWCTMRSTSHRS